MNKEKRIEFAASVAHEANRQYCISINDNSNVHWEKLSEEARRSAMSGASMVHSGNGPIKLHESWLKFKKDHGWRYGPTKNEAMKTHPYMVSYDDLPKEQRFKYDLFIATVNAIMKVTGP